MDEGSTHCPNKACPSVSSSAPLASEPHYSLLISLSDHTGGLDRVRLSGKPASDLLQRTVSHRVEIVRVHVIKGSGSTILNVQNQLNVPVCVALQDIRICMQSYKNMNFS